MQPVLTVITNDLLIAQNKGYQVSDHSREVGDPERAFRCKCILFQFVGDTPAAGLCSGFCHSGKKICHYCHIEGDNSSDSSAGLNRFLS